MDVSSSTTHSSAVASYDAKDTTHMYVDQSEQLSAAAMTAQRTANVGSASKEGAASGQTNIFIPTYSAPLEDPNNGNNAVHKYKFDINAQGNNDRIYTSLNDVPPGLRKVGGFNSGMRAAKRNPMVFATATLSAAVDGSSASDLNSTVTQSHPVADVTASGVSSGATTTGVQGASVTAPNSNALTYSLTL